MFALLLCRACVLQWGSDALCFLSLSRSLDAAAPHGCASLDGAVRKTPRSRRHADRFRGNKPPSEHGETENWRAKAEGDVRLDLCPGTRGETESLCFFVFCKTCFRSFAVIYLHFLTLQTWSGVRTDAFGVFLLKTADFTADPRRTFCTFWSGVCTDSRSHSETSAGGVPAAEVSTGFIVDVWISFHYAQLSSIQNTFPFLAAVTILQGLCWWRSTASACLSQWRR